MVKKLRGQGKLGFHEFEKQLRLQGVINDWRKLSGKLSDLTLTAKKLRDMKRKPRLSNYFDLTTLVSELEKLQDMLFYDYWVNVLGNEPPEILPSELERW